MKPIIKTFKGPHILNGEDAMSLFNESNGWLQEFIGPLTESISGSSDTNFDAKDFSKWAKSLLGCIRIRGERTELMEHAVFACCSYGENWKASYLSGYVAGERMSEVVIVIDDDAQAVQYTLAMS
jgi:hypothetical protein